MLYTAARIYRAAGVENPNEEAENLVTWITSRAGVIDSVTAGELKKRLGIALPDCFVIASAKRIGGRALFKSVEKEMRGVEEELSRLGVLFLEEIRSA